MEKACFDYLTNKEKKFVYKIIKRSKKRNRGTKKKSSRPRRSKRIQQQKKAKKSGGKLDQVARDILAIYGPTGEPKRRKNIKHHRAVVLYLYYQLQLQLFPY